MNEQEWTEEGKELIAEADRKIDQTVADFRRLSEIKGKQVTIATAGAGLRAAGYSAVSALSIAVMISRIVDLEDQIKSA